MVQRIAIFTLKKELLMKSLKNHLSLLLALVSILVTFQFYVTLERVIKAYEDKLASDYSIIAVSNKEVSLDAVKSHTPWVTEVIKIDPAKHISELKNDLTTDNYALLSATLPKFYRIKLSHYPSERELETITHSLSSYNGFFKVESFTKSHNKTFQLLQLVKFATLIFLGMIGVTALLLMIKQMEVWKYEHSLRMSIMEIFGAPLLMRSGVLIRLAVIDSVLSALVAGSLFFFASFDPTTIQTLKSLGIESVEFDMARDGLFLLAISLGVSLVSAMIVIFKKDRNI